MFVSEIRASFLLAFAQLFYVDVTSDYVFHFDILLLERLNRMLMNVANRTVEKNRNGHATFINQFSRLYWSLSEWGARGIS